MVYQRGEGRERKRGNTRCLGCNYGFGQFQVEYAPESNFSDGDGGGYCSLDCYTSAKVRGKARREITKIKDRQDSQCHTFMVGVCFGRFSVFGGDHERKAGVISVPPSQLKNAQTHTKELTEPKLF